MYTTEAWVIHEIPAGTKEPARLRKEAFSFGDLSASEVLIEPIFGSWEGNMNHAIERRPLDVCRSRGEPRVVLGNSGVVRVLRTGAAVTHLPGNQL